MNYSLTFDGTMASHALSNDFSASSDAARVYSICFFDRGLVVPQVTLIDATTDADAISQARSMNRFTVREIWDRHRLIAVIPAAG